MNQATKIVWMALNTSKLSVRDKLHMDYEMRWLNKMMMRVMIVWMVQQWESMPRRYNFGCRGQTDHNMSTIFVADAEKR